MQCFFWFCRHWQVDPYVLTRHLRVWKNDEKAIYFRMVDDPGESVSAFAMMRCSDGNIEDRFARNLLQTQQRPGG